MLSQLEYSGRLDAEYYRPQWLAYEDLLRKRNCKHLSSTADFLIGPFGSAFTVENYTEDKKFRYIRGKDVKPMQLMDNDNVYMPQADFERLSKYALKKDDILISVVGTVGNAAIIEEDNLPAIFSCKSTVVRVNGVNPHYLLTYLNSKFGKSLLRRKERGAVQQGLNLDDLRRLDFYEAKQNFQEAISKFYKIATGAKNSAKIAYSQAEKFLLNFLDLENFSPSVEKFNIKSIGNSFLKTGRLDAEHYQPKYDQLEDAFNKFPGGTTTVGVLAGEFANGAEVREYQEEGTPYLRIGDLKFLDVDAASVVRIDPASAKSGLEKIGLQAGDVLLSRSGSLAVAAVVEPAWENALISSHLIRLRIKDSRIDPYFLALFFMTLPGKMQIQQWSNGGVQPEISQPAVKVITVPILEWADQQEIRRLILLARKLRTNSDNLLQAAKRAVEIAIEQDEAAAMAYLAALEVLP